MSHQPKYANSTIIYPFQRVRTTRFCRGIDDFMRTPFYFVLLGLLTVFSAVYSMELVTYTIFVLIGIYIALLGSDLLPLMPLPVLSYIAPSLGNNPSADAESIFYGWQSIYLGICAGILVLCLLVRLVSDPEIGRGAFLKCKRSLLSGMLILGVGYMLGGAFSGYYTAYGWRNALYAFLQFISVFLCYYLFTGAVRWEKAPKAYWAWFGICMGLVLLVQLCHIYSFNHVILNGKIGRSRIYTGWGTYNNLGVMLAMALPFVFQLACKNKYSWFYEIIAILLMLGIVLTCSRSSLLVAALVYPVCFIVMVRKSKRRTTGLVHYALVVVLIALVFTMREELLHLFKQLLEKGLDGSGRNTMYARGLRQFLRFPIFGGTFFPVEQTPADPFSVAEFVFFFPPSWHNTPIQMLASCGIVGLLAYGFHRVQTIKLFFTTRSTGNTFIGISLFILLATSLLDCHFFNCCPTLFYSMALAFAEKVDVIKQE